MNIDQFKQKRLQGTKLVTQKIISTFSKNGAVAIHQFGSFAKGSEDELSDQDIWITIKDEDLSAIINKRDELYSQIGKIIIKIEPPQNAPTDGMYSLVIHETNQGLFHVDYYLAKLSQTKILPESKVIYGDDNLPRGDWFEDQIKDQTPTKLSPSERIDFIICMSFIGVKYVVRKIHPFLDFLFKQHDINKNEYFPDLEEINNTYEFKTIYQILQNHLKVSNDQQKKAINKVTNYLSEVEDFYK
jgi:predicted nucleotidyltransferase